MGEKKEKKMQLFENGFKDMHFFFTMNKYLIFPLHFIFSFPLQVLLSNSSARGSCALCISQKKS